jgi:hypothetical protein
MVYLQYLRGLLFVVDVSSLGVVADTGPTGSCNFFYDRINILLLLFPIPHRKMLRRMLDGCWTEAGQKLDGSWTDDGQKLNGWWTEAGRMMERSWANAGRMLDGCWAIWMTGELDDCMRLELRGVMFFSHSSLSFYTPRKFQLSCQCTSPANALRPYDPTAADFREPFLWSFRRWVPEKAQLIHPLVTTPMIKPPICCATGPSDLRYYPSAASRPQQSDAASSFSFESRPIICPDYSPTYTPYFLA